ncbi:ABC transporter ATP-binding protein [Halovenus rubra]|uniref:ABC transporter ATP-binding protein n=2 Tax=Halovenus rubra TaxID=869890 RepID=A0ACC7DYQ4_9EURY|nr:ABC transporter ATP-binding protein [Halovenus rubra]
MNGNLGNLDHKTVDESSHKRGHNQSNDAEEAALEVDNLSKRFGDGAETVTAVDSVSFEIQSGSIVGLLGPNGAGKTTLIKSILGMVLPDDGTVRLDGVDIRDQPRTAYAQVDAMLEGARNDYWRLTVRENLRYFSTVAGVHPDAVADEHQRLLEQLDLEEKADVAVRDLSRGMKQKVSLASVLAGGAKLVFLDEPTLGLDVESSRTLQTELRRLATEQDITVVLSSHNMDVIETVCDRVLIMSDGEFVADDSVEELLRSTDVYGVRIVSGDFDEKILSRLREMFEVTTVEALSPGARVEVETEGDGIYELMDWLRARDVTPERVMTVEPGLEDLFLDLTDQDTRTVGGELE